MRHGIVLGVLVTGLVVTGMPLADASPANGTTAAQDAADPGWIQPDSTLYGLAVLKDRVALRLGLTTPGAVIQKRAVQAQLMADRGSHDAMNRVLRDLSRLSDRTTAADVDELAHARSTVQTLHDRDGLPDDARQGVQTALTSIDAARNRAGVPVDPAPEENRTDTAEQATDVKLADARALREEGRDSLDRGVNLMDHERYEEARNAFVRAEELFREAERTLEGVETDAAQELRGQLRDAQQGAAHLQQSVQAYMDGDTELAQEHARQAETRFER